MAVWTFKKVGDEILSELLPPEYLDAQLASGWIVNESGIVDTVTKEEADTNDSGKLSIDEVRAAAKEAGLDGWDTKRKATLEAELWPTQK